MTKKNKLRVVGGTVLLAAILLSGWGYTERMLEYCGLRSLEVANDDYLESAFDRSLKLFAILSGVKVGLAVVEGSEVGVGFGLELGDVVQAAYDHVDIAWKTVLAAGVILQSVRYFLSAADLLDQWFLTLALLMVAFMLAVRWFCPGFLKMRRAFRDLGLFLTVMTVAMYLLLPLSVAGGRFLSLRITEPSLNNVERDLTRFQEEITREENGDDSLLSGLKNTKDKLTKLSVYLTEKAKELVILLLTIIAVYLFDCVVFPLSLFLFLLWTTRLAARYLFGLKRTQNFNEDLEHILAKFHGPAIRR